ncbi:CHAT domain-containing protein [Rapidithrix thailandica]|uniref:CHAT domain-containing protein n=1 Tax=Rapidithrix thailandica TaxID=413964 RepID=A0AAW9RYJ4_9BACT
MRVLVCLSVFHFVISVAFAQSPQSLQDADKTYLTVDSLILELQYDQAVGKLREIYPVYEQHKQWEKYFQCLYILKDIMASKGDSTEAQHYALNLRTKSQELSTAADQYFKAGNQYLNQGNYDMAVEYHQKAIAIRVAVSSDQPLSTEASFEEVSEYYEEKIRSGIASLSYFQKSIEAYKKAGKGESPEMAFVYLQMGKLYFRLKSYGFSEQYLQKALGIYQHRYGAEHISLVEIYQELGKTYGASLQYEDAIDAYKSALLIQRNVRGDRQGLTVAFLNQIGTLYLQLGSLNQALDYIQQGLSIHINLYGKESPSLVESYNKLGDVYRAFSKWDKAIEYYQKSYQLLLKNHGYSEMLGETYIKLGDAYHYRQSFDTALNYYQQAFDILQKLYGTRHQKVAMAYSQLGKAYRSIKNYRKSVDNYQKALGIYRSLYGLKHATVAITYFDLAEMYLERGQSGRALNNFQQAIMANVEGFDNTNMYANPGLKRYYDQRLLLQSLRKKADLLEQRFQESRSKQDLHAALEVYQLCDTLIDHIQQSFVSQSDKLMLAQTATEVYQAGISLAYVMENPYLGFYFSEKSKSGVLLESIVDSEAKTFAGIPDSLLRNERKLRAELAALNKQLVEETSTASYETLQEELFKKKLAFEELTRLFEYKYPKYHELKIKNETAQLPEIQKVLHPEMALIEYFLTDDALYVFTVLKDDFFMDKVSLEKDFSRQITGLRNSILYKIDDLYVLFASELYETLFPRELPAQVKEVVIIPDGPLSQVPFEALLTHGDGDPEALSELPYLIKKWGMSYAYSATLFEETVSRYLPLASFDFVGYAPVFSEKKSTSASHTTRSLLSQINTLDSTKTRGLLDERGNIVPIPGTEVEIKKIARIFRKNDKITQLYTYDDAREGYLKEGRLGDYKFLHIATHGFVNEEEPELSGILFAQETDDKDDGVLYSGELYNLQLNAQLVVLSACETGLGKYSKGEGIIGLTRALLYAGTKNILVSLWQVSDKSTTELMVDLYDEVLQNEFEDFSSAQEMHITRALRDAKLKMIEKGNFAHPYYWSPFVLIGR